MYISKMKLYCQHLCNFSWEIICLGMCRSLRKLVLCSKVDVLVSDWSSSIQTLPGTFSMSPLCNRLFHLVTFHPFLYVDKKKLNFWRKHFLSFILQKLFWFLRPFQLQQSVREEIYLFLGLPLGMVPFSYYWLSVLVFFPVLLSFQLFRI